MNRSEKEGDQMNNRFYTAKDVSQMLGVSESKAYKLIKDMNNELAGKGYITLSGKIPKVFFNEKCYGGEQVS